MHLVGLPLFASVNATYGSSISDIQTYFASKGSYSLWDFRPGSNSIYSDTTLTTPITTASVGVAAVKDLGSLGRNLTQATSGARPLSNLTLGSVFDGVDDTLTSSGAYNTASASFVGWMVAGQGTFAGGVFTNTTDQSASGMDGMFMAASGDLWDSSSSQSSPGSGPGSNFRNNQVATTAWTTGSNRCYYTDARTLTTVSKQFPTGIMVGQDRNNAGRFLNFSILVMFSHTSVLNDTDRDWIEKTFSNMFSLGF